MHVFLVEQRSQESPALARLEAEPVEPGALVQTLHRSTPAVVIFAAPAEAISAAEHEISASGLRFETLLIAAVDDASEVEAALDTGVDEVLVVSAGMAAVDARIRAGSHHLRRRLALVDSSREAFEVYDSNGILQFANPVFEAMTGLRLDQLRGISIVDLLGDDRSPGASRLAIQSAVEVGAWTGVLPARVRGGARQQHEMLLWTIRRRNGDVGWVVGRRRDVTERVITDEQVRLLEAELRRTEHLATIGTLAAGVAHEINNPLPYVMGNLSFVLDSVRGHGLGQETEALRDAMEGCERVKRIVADLRLFSRNSNEDVEVLELEPVLESAANIAAAELRRRARLVRDFANVPPVRGTRARLGQVFLNLISNAAHAIAPGNPDRNEVRLRTGVGEDGWVFVEVSDTGSGMTAEVLSRIFEPFFTTKAAGDGTGLGLSLSHGIITALGGTLTATSEVGVGSVFRVELLPAPRTSLFARSAARSMVPAPTRRSRVLVIDDELQVGRAMQRVLSEHDVTIVTSPREARSVLQSQPAFDAVFCDVIMPGTSGIDLFREPLSTSCATPRERWVFMSGGTRELRLADFLQGVDNPFLAKPCGPGEILAALSRVLSVRSEPPPPSRSTQPARARSSGSPGSPRTS